MHHFTDRSRKHFFALWLTLTAICNIRDLPVYCKKKMVAAGTSSILCIYMVGYIRIITFEGDFFSGGKNHPQKESSKYTSLAIGRKLGLSISEAAGQRAAESMFSSNPP